MKNNIKSIIQTNDIEKYLPKSREYYRKFISSYYHGYCDIMRDSKVGYNTGYPNFHRDTEVVQHIRDIVCNFEDVFKNVNIPEDFPSPQILISTWTNFYNLLLSKNELFEDVQRQEKYLPQPFWNIKKAHEETLEMIKMIISMSEVKGFRNNDNIKDIARIYSETSVFVSYAWGNENFNNKVVSFVNFLRENGYNASMDKLESQKETATNFNKMMIQSIQNSNKVIIILSPKYKERADTFSGGAGFEFNMVLNELKNNDNKFIFVSFGTNSREEITPLSIKEREVIDLKQDQDNNYNSLFAKLEDKSTIIFSDINKDKVEVKQLKPSPFKLP